jgi:hypothetical protein
MGQWGFFSDRENEIVKIIGSNKTMTLQKIAEQLFQDVHKSDRPFDTEISVGNSVRRIIKKAEHYGLAWTLVKKRTDGKMYIIKEKVC